MPLTDDFSYKLGDNGIVLNPDSTMLPFVDIEKVTGLDNAPYRSTTRDHEGTDGGYIDAEFEQARSVVLEGTLYADPYDAEPYLDTLKANYAPRRTLLPFYFKKPGVSERFLRVKPLGCNYDVTQLRRVGQTSIQFSMYAEDPLIYSSNMHSISVQQQSVILGGRGYNKSYNYGYDSAMQPTGLNVVVSGNRPTPVVFIIYGPASYPRIINDSLGKSLEFDIVLTSGDYLTVDTYYHTVMLNGVANRRSSLLTPDWFSLLPGDNYLRYRPQSNTNSTMVVQYYDAWR